MDDNKKNSAERENEIDTYCHHARKIVEIAEFLSIKYNHIPWMVTRVGCDVTGVSVVSQNYSRVSFIETKSDGSILLRTLYSSCQVFLGKFKDLKSVRGYINHAFRTFDHDDWAPNTLNFVEPYTEDMAESLQEKEGKTHYTSYELPYQKIMKRFSDTKGYLPTSMDAKFRDFSYSFVSGVKSNWIGHKVDSIKYHNHYYRAV